MISCEHWGINCVRSSIRNRYFGSRCKILHCSKDTLLKLTSFLCLFFLSASNISANSHSAKNIKLASHFAYSIASVKLSKKFACRKNSFTHAVISFASSKRRKSRLKRERRRRKKKFPHKLKTWRLALKQMRKESGCGNFTASDTAIVLGSRLKLFLLCFFLYRSWAHTATAAFPLCINAVAAVVVVAEMWCEYRRAVHRTNIVGIIALTAALLFAAISRAKQTVFFRILSACWSKHTSSSWHSTVVTSAHEFYFQFQFFFSFISFHLFCCFWPLQNLSFGSNGTVFFCFLKPTISGKSESGVGSFSLVVCFSCFYFQSWSKRRFLGDIQLFAVCCLCFFRSFALLSSCACGFNLATRRWMTVLQQI